MSCIVNPRSTSALISAMSETLAIFGGTFSPPHMGHVHAAEAFCEHIHPDRFLIIPTYFPPHKQHLGTASPTQRIDMCRLAFGHIPNVEVSDIEITRGGVSYTADTLEALSCDGRKLAFLCGTDMMLTLDRWYAPEKIFALCDIYCIRRECDETLLAQIEQANARYFEKFGKRVTFIDASEVIVSSTEIREALRQGKKHPMLPEKVAEYIIERGIYL